MGVADMRGEGEPFLRLRAVHPMRLREKRASVTDIRSLKKAASRAGTTLMQKTGQVERTVDREFAEEEGRYRTCVQILLSFSFQFAGGILLTARMEKETQNLQKEAKSYLDAMRGELQDHRRLPS